MTIAREPGLLFLLDYSDSYTTGSCASHFQYGSSYITLIMAAPLQAIQAKGRPMHTIPIADRPPHGPIASKILFPFLMVFGLLGIASTTLLATPLLLLGPWGVVAMDAVVAYTKDGFGRLRELTAQASSHQSSQSWSCLLLRHYTSPSIHLQRLGS